MNCQNCDQPMKKLRATQENRYHYKESGLQNVYLVGITVYRCERCGEEVPVIPKILQLHRVIAQDLIWKAGLLNGREFRFVRKHAGFPAKEFASLIRVDASHLSRFENGKRKTLGKTADVWGRMIALLVVQGESNRLALLDFAKKMVEEQRARRVSKRPTFKLVKDNWRFAA